MMNNSPVEQIFYEDDDWRLTRPVEHGAAEQATPSTPSTLPPALPHDHYLITPHRM